MNPLMGLALAHPAEPPVHHLERGGLQVDPDQQQPVLGGWQRTMLVGRVAPGDPRLPVEAPSGHMGLERGLKGQDQLPKLLHGETGQIQELRGPGLDIGKRSISHGDGLLLWEAQDTINRD
jgi:hypothetical protein